MQIKVQNSVSVRGLYDTGADISCLSLKVFRQIPPEPWRKKIEQSLLPKFKSAGGETLPVHGKYKLKAHVGTKEIQHEFYVISELNEPLILGIDFIRSNNFGTVQRIDCLPGKGNPTGAPGT